MFVWREELISSHQMVAEDERMSHPQSRTPGPLVPSLTSSPCQQQPLPFPRMLLFLLKLLQDTPTNKRQREERVAVPPPRLFFDVPPSKPTLSEYRSLRVRSISLLYLCKYCGK